MASIDYMSLARAAAAEAEGYLVDGDINAASQHYELASNYAISTAQEHAAGTAAYREVLLFRADCLFAGGHYNKCGILLHYNRSDLYVGPESERAKKLRDEAGRRSLVNYGLVTRDQIWASKAAGLDAEVLDLLGKHPYVFPAVDRSLLLASTCRQLGMQEEADAFYRDYLRLISVS